MIVQNELFIDLASEVLRRNGLLRFKAYGSSMYPIIRHGATIAVRPVEPNAVKFGDIVFSFLNGRALVHRVIGRCTRDGIAMFILRGDCSNASVNIVPQQNVLGCVENVAQKRRLIRPNHGLYRIVGLFWAMLPGLGQTMKMMTNLFNTLGLGLLSVLQSFKLYRLIMKRCIGKQVIYRVASPKDAYKISRLLGHSNIPEAKDPVSTMIRKMEGQDGAYYVLVALVRNKIVGAITIQKNHEIVSAGPDWWIGEFRVRAKYRGAGIGRGLIIKAGFKALHEGAQQLGGDVLRAKHNVVDMCEAFRGDRISPDSYHTGSRETESYKFDHHVIFYRSIEMGLEELDASGVLDQYKGTGCLSPD